MPRSPRKRPEGTSGLVRVGELDLLKNMVKDAPPLSPTRAQARVAAAAKAIYLDPPDPQELAFLARELVQCTLPHSNPGQVPFWARTNGNMTRCATSLGLQAGEG